VVRLRSIIEKAKNQNHRSLRSCEKIGSQAKAPAPLDRKSLCVNVGQALSPGVLSMICIQGVKVPHGP
jgi:hypothetical protein